VTEKQLIALVRSHVEAQFPKTCSKCGRVFATFADYVRDVKHVGAPILLDAATEDRAPPAPFVAISMANCACGTTLALASHNMSPRDSRRLVQWIRKEMERRGVALDQLLTSLRAKIDAEVLAERTARSIPDDSPPR
jgi:hypothetical protein